MVMKLHQHNGYDQYMARIFRSQVIWLGYVAFQYVYSGGTVALWKKLVLFVYNYTAIVVLPITSDHDQQKLPIDFQVKRLPNVVCREFKYISCYFIYCLQKTSRLDRDTGASNVRYTVESRVDITIAGAPVKIINVLLDCDLQATPWCLKPEYHTVYKAKGLVPQTTASNIVDTKIGYILRN